MQVAFDCFQLRFTLNDAPVLAHQAKPKRARAKRTLKKVYGEEYDLSWGGSQSQVDADPDFQSPKRPRQVRLAAACYTTILVLVLSLFCSLLGQAWQYVKLSSTGRLLNGQQRKGYLDATTDCGTLPASYAHY